MLKATRSHQEFQALASVWYADLFKVAKIVGYRYSPTKGTPARDPVDMFRSLLLMELLHERSIDTWVNTMRSTPIFSILSVFLPNEIPGVGTFYDFIQRLWLASSAPLSSKLNPA
ncbi:hypothetical protein [Pelosinus sp. IPA-1]|uniref:hypothetical protein n=1 Tax=Pelosinus sp. IPA-1 TaxID=3029569 RepID=UPI0024362181|nr:hypothetical protein [Pelosinus sp. IPA-1]GMB01783.1 hypothetical protein PIPA1_45830 [Pelosinus sp. IPA-1]